MPFIPVAPSIAAPDRGRPGMRASPSTIMAAARLAFVLVWFAQPLTGWPQSAGWVAPSNYFARSWLVDSGLPHNAVNRIVQDARGFLWVATVGGLARFDGREFREFPVPVDAASLNIRDLAVEDSSTLVMLPSNGGVVRLRDNVFSYHPVNAAVAGKTLLGLFVEPNGTLWLATGGPMVMRWQDGRLATLGPAEGLHRRTAGQSFFAIDGEGRTWISSGDYLGWYRDGHLIRVPVETGSSIVIAPARSGGIWVSTDERLLKWERDRLVVVCDPPAWLPATATVQQLFEDHAGVLWIGTRREGLFRLTDGIPVAVPTTHYRIKAMTEDKESNLWISTDGGGINRLRRKTFALLDSTTGLPSDSATSVCEDATGGLWCADQTGGVVRIEGGRTQVLSRLVNQIPVEARNVCPDREDNIWIGATGGLYRTPADGKGPMTKLEPDLRPVRVLYCSRAGDMWAASGSDPGPGYQLGYFHQGVYRRLSAADGFNGKDVRAITEAADGGVWIGTDNDDLLEFRDGRLVNRTPPGQPLVGRINVLHGDTLGGLWIGTEQGLVLLRSGHLCRLTRVDGLPDDFITQMLEDDHGRLWLSSRRGFFCVSIAELYAFAAGRVSRVTATTFGRDEGLPGTSPPTGGLPMAWKAHNGRLWFATSSGVVGFDPEASLPARPPPAVYVDQTLVDGLPAAVAAAPRVPPGRHRVEFRFVALNYSAPEKVRMRHQLIGVDPDWVDTGPDWSASYVQLPAGRYSLHVIAGNQDGTWNNEGATLPLTVIPFWWQTWWSRAGFFLGFTGLVVWAARLWTNRRLKLRLERLERTHTLEKERARIARNLHDDLGGSLTQIGLLAGRLNRQAERPDLKAALRQLAWRTRSLAGDLERIVWSVSPRNDTWDRLASFIAQSAQRFFEDTPMECTVEGRETIPALALAPDAQHHVLAVVKEAMNNVLKHSQATRVTLVMTFNNGAFGLRLSDNGLGFDPEARENAERNGLANMRTRVAEIGGTLSIASTRGRGTSLALSVPQNATLIVAGG